MNLSEQATIGNHFFLWLYDGIRNVGKISWDDIRDLSDDENICPCPSDCIKWTRIKPIKIHAKRLELIGFKYADHNTYHKDIFDVVFTPKKGWVLWMWFDDIMMFKDIREVVYIHEVENLIKFISTNVATT